jgi:hypothetical protein
VSLDLMNCSIDGDGCARLAHALYGNTSLAALVLADNAIGDQGACCIAQMLEKNRALATLDLGTTGIGVVGVRALCAALSRTCTLTSLSLHGNKLADLGDEVPALLATALQANTTLSSLALDRHYGGHSFLTSLTAPFESALARNFTLCEVEGVPGLDGLLTRNKAVVRRRKENVGFLLFLLFFCLDALATHSPLLRGQCGRAALLLLGLRRFRHVSCLAVGFFCAF